MKKLLLPLLLLISINASAAEFAILNDTTTGHTVVIHYDVCVDNHCEPQRPATIPYGERSFFYTEISVPPGKIATVIGKMGTMNGTTINFGRACRVELKNHQVGSLVIDNDENGTLKCYDL